MENLLKPFREVIYNGEDRRDIYTIAKRIIIASLPNIRLYAVHEEAKSMMLMAFNRFLKRNPRECGKSQSKAKCSKHPHHKRCCCSPKTQIVNILQSISQELVPSPTLKRKTSAKAPSMKITPSLNETFTKKAFVSNSPSPVSSDFDKDSAFGSLEFCRDATISSVNFECNSADSDGYTSSCASASGYFKRKLNRSNTFVITPNLRGTSSVSSLATLNKVNNVEEKCYTNYARFQPEDNLQWDYNDLRLSPENHRICPSIKKNVSLPELTSMGDVTCRSSTSKGTKPIRKRRASFPRRSARLVTNGKYANVDVNITISKDVNIVKANRKFGAKQSGKCCNSTKLLKQLKSIVCSGFECCNYEYRRISSELSIIQCENIDIMATLSDAKANCTNCLTVDEALGDCLTTKFELLDIRKRLGFLECMVTPYKES